MEGLDGMVIVTLRCSAGLDERSDLAGALSTRSFDDMVVVVVVVVVVRGILDLSKGDQMNQTKM